MQVLGLSRAPATILTDILLADSEYSCELKLDAEPVKGLLPGLFIAVGMSVDMSLLANSPLIIFGFVLLVVITKMAILLGLRRIFKLSYLKIRYYLQSLFLK